VSRRPEGVEGVSLDPKLLEILACPGCHGRIRELPDTGRLECVQCRRSYPVQEGIPILLLERAEVSLEDDT
jgi:uncharacterized protein YbaR (Trm112 family)